MPGSARIGGHPSDAAGRHGSVNPGGLQGFAEQLPDVVEAQAASEDLADQREQLAVPRGEST
ncbi:MAG TPA: hypothetical protein VNH82_09960 [Candidatus Dormibacteraeota bacterium]|nr:hypothetical protein [Candidatus Dormibacteraeota bacterium]